MRRRARGGGGVAAACRHGGKRGARPQGMEEGAAIHQGHHRHTEAGEGPGAGPAGEPMHGDRGEAQEEQLVDGSEEQSDEEVERRIEQQQRHHRGAQPTAQPEPQQ
jgi:hypothetical protein